MNAKQSQGYGVLVILLILSLTVLSCGQGGGGGGQGETTQSSAVAATQPNGTGSSAGGDQTTTSQPPGEQTTAEASTTSSVPSAASLGSYRIHTVWRDGGDQGPIKDEWTTEYVANPLAVYHKAAGDMAIEMIFVGKTLWTKFMDQPWNRQELAEGDTANWASTLSQAKSPVDVEEQTPLEDAIQWLMGQSEVKIAKGSLTLVGQETVNGVGCKRYSVDSTYTYSVTYQAPMKGSATVTEGTKGVIWAADEGGFSPFVVRAQVLQTTTTKVEAGGSSTKTVHIEENVTDINSSDIVIAPPE